MSELDDYLRERFAQVMVDEAVLGNVFFQPRGFPSEERLVCEVEKMTGYVWVSDELLHPERYPAPKVSRWTRFRWRLSEYRYRLGLAWDVLRDRHECDT